MGGSLWSFRSSLLPQAYFSGDLSFGQLMMVVGAFNQVQQALRWLVDNTAVLADWRATAQRVDGFPSGALRSRFPSSIGRIVSCSARILKDFWRSMILWS